MPWRNCSAIDERVRLVIGLDDDFSVQSERLLRRLPHEVKVPACSIIHAILDRHGLVTRAFAYALRRHATFTRTHSECALAHGL